MYKALVVCKAGMGSSMMLKIKADQVIKESELPIVTQHGSVDSIADFKGDLILTQSDFADKVDAHGAYVASVDNILDKDKIKAALEGFLAAQKD
ncbi:PTS sugar transporter subunit IIB [Atopobiaceae bacterium 24-176]